MTDEDLKTLKLLEDLIRRVVREELDKDRAAMMYRPFPPPSPPPNYPGVWGVDIPTVGAPFVGTPQNVS